MRFSAAIMLLPAVAAGAAAGAPAGAAPDGPDSPCKSDWDCSLNGVCTSGKCGCDAEWSGSKCATLNLIPAAADPKTMGVATAYPAPADFNSTTSWGGSVVKVTQFLSRARGVHVALPTAHAALYAAVVCIHVLPDC